MSVLSNAASRRVFLRACCRALMCADNPADLTGEERKALEEFCNEEAQVQGFANWTEAFHNI